MKTSYNPRVDSPDNGWRLPLLEVTDVVLSLKEEGLKPDAIASKLGETGEWVRELIALARDPVARTLLNAERLTSVKAWKAFIALPAELRRRVLDSDEPIDEGECQRLKMPHNHVTSR
jgi:hypothetical protein